MYFSTTHVRDYRPCYHCASIMLCYPILINVSNIKENTLHTHSQAHVHTCTHAHVHADPYHNLNTQGGFVFQPALGYHQLVSYNHNHNAMFTPKHDQVRTDL